MPNYICKIGESTDRNLVGGKGASLSVMSKLGLNVPPGFTITTTAWKSWKAGRIKLETLYTNYIEPALSEMFPNLDNGQMVSVRSGAPLSMPGMMETVLNLGANNYHLRAAYALSYIKASGLDVSVANNIIDKQLLKQGAFFMNENSMSSASVKELLDYAGPGTGGSVKNRIMSAVQLVFESWDSEKARVYREQSNIPDDIGTACTIQLMVDGFDGFSGVMLTRGSENGPQIDWIAEAQGDSVVDGTHPTRNAESLEYSYTSRYNDLLKIGAMLEKEYHDAMDIEFTYDGFKLYVLQCRVAKRTPVENMRIMCQLYQDGIIDKQRLMNTPAVDDSVETVSMDNDKFMAHGFPISCATPVTGKLSLKPTSKVDKDDIVLREITTTSDIKLMLSAAAVVTLMGGPTCHAALVAREMSVPTVVGVSGSIDLFKIPGKNGYHHCWRSITGKFAEHGDTITVTPNGDVYLGEVEVEIVRTPGVWSVKLAELTAETPKPKKKKATPKKVNKYPFAQAEATEDKEVDHGKYPTPDDKLDSIILKDVAEAIIKTPKKLMIKDLQKVYDSLQDNDEIAF